MTVSLSQGQLLIMEPILAELKRAESRVAQSQVLLNAAQDKYTEYVKQAAATLGLNLADFTFDKDSRQFVTKT
jgi:hypothetical protein